MRNFCVSRKKNKLSTFLTHFTCNLVGSDYTAIDRSAARLLLDNLSKIRQLAWWHFDLHRDDMIERKIRAITNVTNADLKFILTTVNKQIQLSIQQHDDEPELEQTLS